MIHLSQQTNTRPLTPHDATKPNLAKTNLLNANIFNGGIIPNRRDIGIYICLVQTQTAISARALEQIFGM